MPSTKYLKAVWARAREIGIDREALHDAIRQGFGLESVKDLTDAQASKLLSGMSRELSAERRREMALAGRRGRQSNREVLVSASELAMLRRLAAARGWSDETLATFAARQCGSAQPRTMAEFNRVLWPLKAMDRRDDAGVR